MTLAWGLVVVGFALLAWAGQMISWCFPEAAVRWNLMEAEHNVEPAFAADGKGEAIWDTFTLWILLAAGGLLILDHDWWPYFGLVGGGIYLYFAGRTISTRVVMRRRGMRIGTPQNITLGYVFSTLWAIVAVVTMIAAVAALEP